MDVKNFVNFNILLLHLFGYFHPKITQLYKKICYKIYAYFFLGFTYVLFLSSQIAFMIVAFGDLEQMTEGSFLLVTNMNQGLKIYVFLFHGEKVWQLIDSVDREEFQPINSTQFGILSKEMKTSNLNRNIFLIMGVITCILWGVFPLLDNSEKRLPLGGWFPFDTTQSPIFEIVYLHQIFAVSAVGLGNITMDTFIAGCIKIISGELAILNHAIQEMNKNQVTQDLIHNVNHHRNIIQFAENLTSIFTFCITCQFLVSVVIICMTMFQISLVSVASLQFFSMVLYQSCILLEIFLWCYYGNEVIIQSNSLTDSAYSCDWTDCTKKSKQDLLFFMTRTLTPLKLYAGGYFTLSLDTFVAIVKSAWSYFAVLNSVHSQEI